MLEQRLKEAFAALVLTFAAYWIVKLLHIGVDVAILYVLLLIYMYLDTKK